MFYYHRLKDSIPAVQNILLPGQSAAEISAQVDLETKTVSELLELNIWDHDVCTYISIILYFRHNFLLNMTVCYLYAENKVLLHCCYHKT